MTVSSFIEGRLRIRDGRLKDERFSRFVKEKISNQNGVIEVKFNPITGSMLIIYDRNLISRETILDSLREFLSPQERSFTLNLSRVNREIAIPGMLLSLILSLLGLGFLGRRLHLYGGIAFLGFLMIHLYYHRKLLIPKGGS